MAITILAYGDSITAGYGLAQSDGFTAQLQASLRQEGIDATVINGGNSGDTSAAGLARLDWSLADKPDYVLLELGINDALRGIDPVETRRNLQAIIAKVRARNIPILLLGMKAPRNLGPAYVSAFDSLYPELSRQYGIALYPFFLEGVAMDPRLNQGDGIHPNQAGIAEIVRRLLPYVKRLIGA
ncbi:MAG TPA: arylesterase [Dongiaceae bacterium]|jgi:acyl-CoA thioesterase-1|nr:arylesterase [Dongiaceae bacterium]